MNFRRWITALAVLALFAGFASAQIANSNASQGPFQCSASVAVPPVLRAEGLTELVGDIVLTCTGGAVVQPNTPLTSSTANITVSFNTNVTSRLLANAYGVTANSLEAGNTNEALLLIDEPGSSDPYMLPGWGPNAPQVLCGSGGLPNSSIGAGVGGCPEYVEQLTSTVTSLPVNVMVGGTATTPGTTPGPNVFSGVWGGSGAPNQVTFFGIPIMPPTSAGSERVYRITNVRINANTLGGGLYAGTSQVYAYVSISGPTSVPLNNPNLIAGSIQQGLTASLRSPSNGSYSSSQLTQQQCSGTSGSAPGNALAYLRFAENFGSAFKTRTSATGGVAIPTNQNIPGTIYNSESGLIPYSSTAGVLITGQNNSEQVGLADYGTRLKAVFNGLPSGVRMFVSTMSASATSVAQLVLSDTASDGTGSLPAVPITGYSGSTPYAEITNSGGTASATWEVISANSATNENFDFAVWFLYSASPATNSPAPGTATVNLSFAPNTNSGAFSATSGGTSSSTLTVPRFADTSTATSIFTIVPCTTSLLFPFITNQAGFDTGIAIMNTTTDPFGTKPQSGICTLNFYGQNAPAAYPTAVIPSGNSWTPAVGAWMASVIAPNFEGYMIAVCQFQLAHGYSFVSDLGAQKLAHGSLALVLPLGTSSGSRSAPEMLEN
ncbi:MAG: hypothetical protein WBQ65_11705 [Bryobacteraceae bacterium]